MWKNTPSPVWIAVQSLPSAPPVGRTKDVLLELYYSGELTPAGFHDPANADRCSSSSGPPRGYQQFVRGSSHKIQSRAWYHNAYVPPKTTRRRLFSLLSNAILSIV
jgi:hypothetical protein